ncbi:MAG: proline--tRNA ligase [Candidatus Eisenbacteria bacterium]|uniref:Proline--tRNA ligase n=1 Tax=Eiseniibacteriota bacterium TaxID=2212470 RepID=A0A9D6L5I4_UNCEI|nr:proline--tRNA ligase [Candidatus Eisenbacteria bacterium]MBI3540222.1 proline--tRNA ligase [Candidatus Eisenbacteria bacterium]
MSDVQDRKRFVEDLTDQGDDFSRWYTEVVRKAQLADYAPVRGCMVIRPYGFGIWENMQRLLDARIKATGAQNAYFPILIPESLLQLEADHVEGFAPEVAWVTQGGSEPLEERLAIRPTSEAIICRMYSRWIESYRDLPVMMNQWCNAMRWEKVTRLFLRTTEFLWQEGHTAHANHAEATDEVLRMLEVYRSFAEEDLAIPVHAGRKSLAEKFAGAEMTYSIEALMRDGKALQTATSHDLGQHFAKVFDITYQDETGARQHVWQTSWGASTRMIGAVIMSHGDDQGLKLPPRIAPIQAVVVPIWRKDEERAQVRPFVERVREALGDRVRLHVDDRDQYTPGWKYNEHELRGVPIRLEVGPKDVTKGAVMSVRRDGRQKESIPLEALAERLPALLDEVQRAMFDAARAFRDENTATCRTVAEMEAHFVARRGFVAVPWDGSAAFEAEVKEKTGATLRCVPLDPSPWKGLAGPGQDVGLFARAY